MDTSSPFASHVTAVVTLPGRGPDTITIQRVSGKALDAAQLEHMTGVVTGRGRNWATTFMRLAAKGVASDGDAAKVLSDPLSGYDRLTLVQAGVRSWTYQEDGQPKPVTAAAIEDLLDEDLEFLASAVLQLTKPALFQTAEAREDDRKNG